MATASQLKTFTAKEFMTNNGYTQFVKLVRCNSNGYPYITFIDSDNVATNVYFSKAASAMVANGEVLSSPRDFFAKFCFVETTNAQQELRWKISSMGESTRGGLDDL